ncbi:hypothetical protein PsorP6_002911 [Peronosclerospora sorghi]|uniref:Uncharacterized protein n=1 Tax=Peronosclerospora sorghi TaxID=230839 RepID=A0ACC0VLS7_9STRA|nr:hypothetical protein PsorP6_002911 [Peronosclerospora sorghi]
MEQEWLQVLHKKRRGKGRANRRFHAISTSKEVVQPVAEVSKVTRRAAHSTRSLHHRRHTTFSAPSRCPASHSLSRQSNTKCQWLDVKLGSVWAMSSNALHQFCIAPTNILFIYPSSWYGLTTLPPQTRRWSQRASSSVSMDYSNHCSPHVAISCGKSGRRLAAYQRYKKAFDSVCKVI